MKEDLFGWLRAHAGRSEEMMEKGAAIIPKELLVANLFQRFEMCFIVYCVLSIVGVFCSVVEMPGDDICV